MEKWRAVVGYEGNYEVSDAGRIRNSRSGLIRSLHKCQRTKRCIILLWKKNTPKNFLVHTVVLTAFVGPRPEGKECCHNDGNGYNNALPNLRWDTHKANIADKILHGTLARGEKCWAAKLSEAQVFAIRKDTRSQRIIAAEYDVKQPAISRIKSGLRWAHS